MILCPYCDAENIEGADVCDQCQVPLTDLSLRPPATDVERGLLRDRIAALEPNAPLSVGPDTPVGQVLQMMIERRVGCLMVVDGERLLGILTERDALMRINVDAARMAARPVSELMTVNPATLRMRDKIAFALHRMNVGGFRHIPILDDDDKLVGVISIRDILRYLTELHAARG
ncbi:MAG TPA: CBS domain-containing protein [Lacipirellulaceae bacterium]|nr:CBS domain-containing protein [Lacipirellulaceae bacterium]